MQSGLTWHDWIILALAAIGYTFAAGKFLLMIRDDVRGVKSDVEAIKVANTETKGHITAFFRRFERIGETLARVDERMRLIPQRGNNVHKRDDDHDGR